MRRAGIDALVAASASNVYYVSDYYSEGTALGCAMQGYGLLPLDGEPALVAPLSEADLVVESRTKIRDVLYYGCLNAGISKNSGSDVTKGIIAATREKAERTPCESLAKVVAARGLTKKTIAVDGGISPETWEQIKKGLPDARLVDGTKLLSIIRAVKTPEEVEAIARATEITEKSMEDALEIAQVGIAELDLAQMFSYSVAEDGGRVTLTFFGAGERSAYPNPIPTTYQLAKGDLMRMRLGSTVSHYNGIVSRTAAIGQPDAEAEKRLKTVIDAQEAAFDAVRPGAKIGEVYAAVKRALGSHGIGECSESVGHCTGIDCVEGPTVGPEEEALVEEGMVLSVDVPYLELGWGGIQLADTVLVTKKGLRFLTATERTLYVL